MATGDKLRGEEYVVNFDTSVDYSGTYVIVGGLRSNSLSLSMEAIDVSDKASAGWSDVLAGLRSMEVTASGIMLETNAVLVAVKAAALARTKEQFQIIDAYGNYYEGLFFITAFNESGDHNGEHAYDFTLMNAGEVTFTAGT